MICIHDYELIGENDDATIEVCKLCKKKLIMKKDRKGRMNNALYLKEHRRDTLQPTGATAQLFKRFYGRK